MELDSKIVGVRLAWYIMRVFPTRLKSPPVSPNVRHQISCQVRHAGNSIELPNPMNLSYFPIRKPQLLPLTHGQQGNNAHNPLIVMETERSMVPMAPSRQSSIQLMTIKSQKGHHVQIPVDVQAASKVADAKRKRNAEASARFRARRKEKEREASQSISRLEQQIRDAQEDVEYHCTERDYFKSVVFQQPGAERQYARPTSPRLRRTSMPPSIVGGSADSPYSDCDEEEGTPPTQVDSSCLAYAERIFRGEVLEPPIWCQATDGR
jgi:hypothetical protein